MVIATPVSTHFDLAMQALRAGKHVLVEKPFTATVAEGEELIEVAERSGLVLMVDHTFVYTSAVRKISELVEGGAIGRLQYYDSVRVNLGLFQRDVSVLWDLAVHDLSIMDYITGRLPVQVAATGMSHLPGEPENIAYLTCYFADDMLAHFHVNWLAPVKVRQTMICGSEKMILYNDNDASEKIRVYDKGLIFSEDSDALYQRHVGYRTGDMWAPRLDDGRRRCRSRRTTSSNASAPAVCRSLMAMPACASCACSKRRPSRWPHAACRSTCDRPCRGARRSCRDITKGPVRARNPGSADATTRVLARGPATSGLRSVPCARPPTRKGLGKLPSPTKGSMRIRKINRPLVLAGAGGFARETAALVDAINAERPTWDLLGFLDDDPALHGSRIRGRPVLGPIDWAAERSDVAMVVCVGNPDNFTSRMRIVNRLGLDEARYATLIHPGAALPPSTFIGAGTVIGATTVTTCDVAIGAHVAVMPGVILTHDDMLSDYVTIASGVRLAGGVTVEPGAYIGAGALVREQLTIGQWSLVAMGAVVTKSVPAGQVWVGAPARYLRDVRLPDGVLTEAR